MKRAWNGRTISGTQKEIFGVRRPKGSVGDAPTRMFNLIYQRPDLNSFAQIADELGLSRGTVAQHMAALRDAGLIKRIGTGRYASFAINYAVTRSVTDLAGIRSAALAPVSPGHFALAADDPDWVYAPHVQYLNEYLTDFLTDRKERFLLLSASVRHGKSRFVTGDCVAWFRGTYPKKNIILVSYSTSLITGWSRYARDRIEDQGQEYFGIKVRPDVHSASLWQVEPGGGKVQATTLGGQITGGGADLIIIDDPVKNFATAYSQKEREDLWDFYQNTLFSRLEPGGKIIVLMARWHLDDLVGRLKANAAEDRLNPQWEEINLPAIAVAPPSGDRDEWRDAIGRKDGDALWPGRWSLPLLRQRENAVGPLAWAANYQQNPITIDSDIFSNPDWRFCDTIPPSREPIIRRWDLAASGKAGDQCAGVLMTRDAKGITYIPDIVASHELALGAKQLIRRTAEVDRARFGGRVFTRIEQEPGASGKQWAEDIVQNTLKGFPADAKPTSGNKVNGAIPLASQVQAGRVYLVRSPTPNGYEDPPWFDEFAQQCSAFPKGRYDDMVDAASKAYADLAMKAVKSTGVSVRAPSRRRLQTVRPRRHR